LVPSRRRICGPLHIFHTYCSKGRTFIAQCFGGYPVVGPHQRSGDPDGTGIFSMFGGVHRRLREEGSF